MSNFSFIETQFATKLGDLTTSVLEELTDTNKKYKFKDLLVALEQDPVAYACTELKAARCVNSFGEYYVEDKSINEFVNHEFEDMRISLAEVVAKMASALPFGFSTTEACFKKKPNKSRTKPFVWTISDFIALNPANTTFLITKGEVEKVKYTQQGSDTEIPYWKILHIINGTSTSFGKKYVYGHAEVARAYPFIKLKQLIFAEMGVSAKTLATGILVGRADSNNIVQLKDSKGQPMKDASGNFYTISAVENLARQFKSIENHSRIVTDKNNDITSLSVPSGAGFWNMALNMCDEQIMRCFMTPETVWREGTSSLGVGTLSQTQLSVFDSSINAVNRQIKEALLEKVVKPMVKWNFGEQLKYGEFKHETKNDPQAENMIVQSIFAAIGQGIFDGQDLQIQNFLRSKLGLSAITAEEQELKDKMKQEMQAEMEKLKNLEMQTEESKIPEPEETTEES